MAAHRPAAAAALADPETTGHSFTTIGDVEMARDHARRRRELPVPATPHEVYQRYLRAGAMTRNADAVAEMFAVDGVFEAPFVPVGKAFPRRIEGREEIRRRLADYYEREGARLAGLKVNAEKSRYVVHTTADPDVFVVEIDWAFDSPDEIEIVSLVQIFRMRDEEIILLRDYFSPDATD